MSLRVLLLVLLASTAVFAREFHVRADGLADEQLWKQVREALDHEDVEVVLEKGTFLLAPGVELKDLGNATHRFVLRGAEPQGTIIRDAPADKDDRNVLIALRTAKNVTVRHLHFRGGEKLASTLGIRESQNITVERCTWADLDNAFYSAMSIVGDATRDIRVDHCDFRRVGFDAHAHMIYCAYGPQRITIADCHFEDCCGDFVRFRDRADYGVVWNCEFISTGTYKKSQHPMIAVPLFNDDDPNHPRPGTWQEYFGTHFVIAHNLFRYAPDRGDQSTRWATLFHHSGFDPPGRSHLLTPAEAELLRHAAPDERRAMLKSRTNIDLAEVHLFDNRYEHVQHKLVYDSSAAFGAKSKGFSGAIDLSDLIDERPVAGTLDDATKSWPSN